MREVGIKELKRDASAIVDAVEAGETIVITRRGIPVARMGPVACTASRAAARRPGPDELAGWAHERSG